MKALTGTHPETKSADLLPENINRLKALSREAFIRGNVDSDALRQPFGGAVGERE